MSDLGPTQHLATTTRSDACLGRRTTQWLPWVRKVGTSSQRLSVFVRVFLLRFKHPKSLQISKPHNAWQLKSPAFLQELEDCRRNLSIRVQILCVCRLANQVSFQVCWHLFARCMRKLLFFRCRVSWKQINVDVPKRGKDLTAVGLLLIWVLVWMPLPKQSPELPQRQRQVELTKKSLAVGHVAVSLKKGV